MREIDIIIKYLNSNDLEIVQKGVVKMDTLREQIWGRRKELSKDISKIWKSMRYSDKEKSIKTDMAQRLEIFKQFRITEEEFSIIQKHSFMLRLSLAIQNKW